MTVLRSTLSLGLLPPAARRHTLATKMRGTYPPKPRQIVFAYGLAVLAFSLVLLAFALPGTHVPGASNQLNSISAAHQRVELHPATPMTFAMPVP